VTWVFCFQALLVAFAIPGQANTKRAALVIGNAAYAHASELRNPRNDAQAIAKALEQMGFTVISGFDLGHAEMGRTIQRFAAALDGAAVGIFYYAGHGIQINGTNYLVPTDSRLETEHSPDFELIRVDVVQRIMESRYRTNILFLDACRDNPLVRNLSRAMGTRSISIGRGLAPTESGVGTLVSFSTQPGNVALDGAGRHSPYAEALTRHMSLPGVHVGDMLISVRRDVMHATSNKQVPWEHSALTDKFYFSIPVPAPAQLPATAAPPPEAAALPKPSPPMDKAALTLRLHRELKRVGCDPGTVGEKWTDESQTALERFAAITKSALHTDEPTLDALNAVAVHKRLVCPASAVIAPGIAAPPKQPKASQQPSSKKAAGLPPAPTTSKGATEQKQKLNTKAKSANARCIPCVERCEQCNAGKASGSGHCASICRNAGLKMVRRVSICGQAYAACD